jgi:glycosyltransferase involved in cell wall biosynthesis
MYERSGIKRSKNFFCRTKWDSGYVRSLNPDAKIFHNWELIREDFFADNYNERSKNLLFLGGTNHFKGFKETLRCLDVLKKRGYDMRLRICGYGQEDEVVRFLRANYLNIPLQDIDFLGFQPADKLANLFKDSFCMIHPSYMDNSPNSICEAQVSGLPVIASKVGGVSSLIKNEVTGLFVNRYDHLGLTDQICRLLNDINLYRTISDNSKNVARKRHNRETIVGNTLKTYNELARK